MKLAVMIICHKNAPQVERLIRALAHPEVDVFVHVDKKSSMTFSEGLGARFVPENRRQDVRWARFSQVEAELALIDLARSAGGYDYYLMISGQDFPLRPVSELLRHLEENRGTDFMNSFCNPHFMKRVDVFYPEWMIGLRGAPRVIRRGYVALTGGYEHTLPPFRRRKPLGDFAFGSSWWCLTEATISAVTRYAQDHPEVVDFFRNTVCADEAFFQTLRLHTRPTAPMLPIFTYIDWSEGNSSPKTLTMGDREALLASGCFFARKLDADVDGEILDFLEARMRAVPASNCCRQAQGA